MFLPCNNIIFLSAMLPHKIVIASEIAVDFKYHKWARFMTFFRKICRHSPYKNIEWLGIAQFVMAYIPSQIEAFFTEKE